MDWRHWGIGRIAGIRGIDGKIRELEDWSMQWLGIWSKKLCYRAKISNKWGLRLSRGRRVGRAGATGKGRERVI